VISDFRRELDDVCGLLGYYAARRLFLDFLNLEDGTRLVTPKRPYGITTLRCVISQKSAGPKHCTCR